MRKVYVKLSHSELDTLLEVSRAERRHPSVQAAILLARALRFLAPLNGSDDSNANRFARSTEPTRE
jgi:hypothetical protein